MPKQDYGVYKQFNCADGVRCAARRNNKQNSRVSGHSRQSLSRSIVSSGCKFMEF